MNTNTTYTLKRNPAKYANLHKCDQKYWRFSCDFSQPQDMPTLTAAMDDTAKLLASIVKCSAFKAENVEAAKALAKILLDYAKSPDTDLAVTTFVVYQLQRYAFRIWYRDTKAARDAAKPKPEAPAKQEKKPAAKKAPAKQEKKPAAKAPAKQEIEAANEATFVSKLTKAQKRELVLTLLGELLK